MDTEYDFYLGSGWFSIEQEEGRQVILKVANELGLKYFSPKDELICPPDASKEIQEEVFKGNIDAIRKAKFIIVNTAGKDMGTIFEAGAAFEMGKSIVYLCLGLKGNFNLMLSRSGVAVATTEEELRRHLVGITKDIDYKEDYIGIIE